MEKILIKIANICHYESNTPIKRILYSILIMINFIGFYILMPILVFVYWLKIELPEFIILSPIVFWLIVYIATAFFITIISCIDDYISWILGKKSKKFKIDIFELSNNPNYKYTKFYDSFDIILFIVSRVLKYSVTFIPKMIIKTISRDK